MNTAILSEAVQSYIKSKQDADPASLALSKSPFPELSATDLARQVDGRQRACKKIPTLVAQADLYYPDKLNLEQSSSTETALYKAALLAPNKTLIDLTGGFGIDSYYFASVSKQVTHCERNEGLSEIVQYNFGALGVENVQFHSGDGISYLSQSQEQYDYIYTDPSRRVNQQKVFKLSDCEPNVVALQPLFFSKAPIVITKLAPLLDISLALQDLEEVRDVYIISMDNDCKELLFIQEQGYTGEVNLHSVALSKGKSPKTLTFTLATEKQAEPLLGAPSRYLYEPDVALTKAGAFKTTALHYGLTKLHQHSHLYTATMLHEDFLGKVFTIIHVSPFSTFKKENKITKANVISKNFPLKVDEVRKKMKIKDGGVVYLFFTTQADGSLIVIQAERLIF